MNAVLGLELTSLSERKGAALSGDIDCEGAHRCERSDPDEDGQVLEMGQAWGEKRQLMAENKGGWVIGVPIVPGTGPSL